MNIESKTVVKLGITGLIIYAGYFAIDQGAKPVYGNGPASPTPEKYTPTAVRTSTVRALLTPSLTPTSGGRVTETVPPTGTITATPTLTLPELRKKLEDTQTSAAEKSERAKIQAEINKVLGTPTETPFPTSTPTATPSHTPTPTSTPDRDLLCFPREEINKMIADGVDRALKSIPTPTPQIVYITPVVPVGSGNRGEGGSPWQCITGIIAGGIGVLGIQGAAAYLLRERIRHMIHP